MRSALTDVECVRGLNPSDSFVVLLGRVLLAFGLRCADSTAMNVPEEVLVPTGEARHDAPIMHRFGAPLTRLVMEAREVAVATWAVPTDTSDVGQPRAVLAVAHTHDQQ
jgi:hypothetical protein